jgi:hypothetical protein
MGSAPPAPSLKETLSPGLLGGANAMRLMASIGLFTGAQWPDRQRSERKGFRIRESVVSSRLSNCPSPLG